MPDSDRSRLFTAVTAAFVAAVCVFTALAIWDSAVSYTRHHMEAEKYAAKRAADTQDVIKRCADRVDPADMTACAAAAIGTLRDEQRGERDLAAQLDMAKWNFWLLVAAWLGIPITLAGVIYVALTLQATRAAVDAANRTADEAKRIGQAQVRGYLSSDGGQYWLQTRFMWFELGVINRGQSPIFGGDATGLLTIVEKGQHAIQRNILGRFDAASAGERRLCRIHVTNESLPHQALEALKISDGATVILNLTFRWKDVFGVELWATYLFTQREAASLDAIKADYPMYSAKLDAFCVSANWTGDFQHM